MASLKTLKFRAIESCEFRGHQMSAWADGSDGKFSECECTVCGAWVLAETDPLPNGVDVGGPAVAVFCKVSNLPEYKIFQDNLPGGKPIKLEAEVAGIYTDKNGITWTVYIPISVEWQGMYHLVPVNGGEPYLPMCLDERRMIGAMIKFESSSITKIFGGK
jgi:hypothetical protein